MNGVKNGAMIFRFRSSSRKGGVVTNGRTAGRVSSFPDRRRLSMVERTRNLMEPMLLTSSIFSRVSVFPYRFSRSRVSSVSRASGPHPNEVICMHWMCGPCMATHLAAFRIRLGYAHCER